jgi:hypothetical protein
MTTSSRTPSSAAFRSASSASSRSSRGAGPSAGQCGCSCHRRGSAGAGACAECGCGVRRGFLGRSVVSLVVGVLLATLATGCAAAPHAAYKGGPSAAAPAGAPAQAQATAPGSFEGAGPAAEAPPSTDSAAGAAPSPSPAGGRASEQRPADKSADEAARDRPGLATHWGETRESRIRSVSFERANQSNPFATASLWYNDQEGSRAMAQTEGFRAFSRTAVDMAAQGVSISLQDENGHALPGFSAGGKTFAVGRPGSRYSIVLRNMTPARFEAVISVDGLDVIDGREAGFGKRGYLLNPHASLTIEGFRRSEEAVAAFRFGSVRGSYAAKTTGETRNVGVIGVALFHERGVPEWPWDSAEIDRRKSADPFPGRFAAPPQ